jgi:hypothetical protein
MKEMESTKEEKSNMFQADEDCIRSFVGLFEKP